MSVVSPPFTTSWTWIYLGMERVRLVLSLQGCFFLLDSFAFEPQAFGISLSFSCCTMIEQIAELQPIAFSYVQFEGLKQVSHLIGPIAFLAARRGGLMLSNGCWWGKILRTATLFRCYCLWFVIVVSSQLLPERHIEECGGYQAPGRIDIDITSLVSWSLTTVSSTCHRATTSANIQIVPVTLLLHVTFPRSSQFLILANGGVPVCRQRFSILLDPHCIGAEWVSH